MEYVHGESLSRLVRAAQPTAASACRCAIVAAIMCGVLHGLHAAHEATSERGEPLGIVHRDVSPQNMLVGIDGVARVLDFGVAKAAGRAADDARQGSSKASSRTWRPSSSAGSRHATGATSTRRRSCSGRRSRAGACSRGDNEGAVITKSSRVPWMPSAAVPPEETDDATRAMLQAVDEITLKGLATRADDRYDTARAMAVALERVVPPASVAEVSEWVEHFAKDVLVSRAQQVADIESISSVGPTSIQALRDADASDAALTTARESNPRLMPGRTSDASGARSGPVNMSTHLGRVAGAAHRRAPQAEARPLGHGRRRVPRDGDHHPRGGSLDARRRDRRGRRNIGVHPADTPDAADHAPPPPTATVAAEAPPSASAAPVPAPPVKTWTPPIAHPPPRPAPPVAGPAPPPAHPTASCNPPFTYDAKV